MIQPSPLYTLILVMCPLMGYIGAVLSHSMEDELDRPVAYASCSLSQADCRYAQLDSEVLTIVYME